jgi:hypothetical protein
MLSHCWDFFMPLPGKSGSGSDLLELYNRRAKEFVRDGGLDFACYKCQLNGNQLPGCGGALVPLSER